MEFTKPQDTLPEKVERFIKEGLEQRINGYSGVALNCVRDMVLAKQNLDRQAREDARAEENAKFFAGVNIAVDYALGNDGNLPSLKKLMGLHKRGLLSFPVEEVFRVCECETIEDFHALVEPFYQDRSAQIEAERKKLLKEIANERLNGKLPEDLFRATIDSTSSERQKVNEKSGWPSKDLRKFTDGEAPDDEVILRYIRYKLACRLTPNLDGFQRSGAQLEQYDPEARRTNIALQFNRSTNVKYSSLQAELNKATFRPTAELAQEIREICEEEGWYTFYFAREYARDLRHI